MKIDRSPLKQTLIILGIWLSIAGAMYLLYGCGPSFEYEMPNDVRCRNKNFISYVGYEFYNCSDGKNYVNPASYREVKR